jgi:hypothetical protein
MPTPATRHRRLDGAWQRFGEKTPQQAKGQKTPIID